MRRKLIRRKLAKRVGCYSRYTHLSSIEDVRMLILRYPRTLKPGLDYCVNVLAFNSLTSEETQAESRPIIKSQHRQQVDTSIFSKTQNMLVPYNALSALHLM
jgi:hypothetical protein